MEAGGTSILKWLMVGINIDDGVFEYPYLDVGERNEKPVIMAQIYGYA